jgi:UDP-N-acetylglucosamine 2-epimerase
MGEKPETILAVGCPSSDIALSLDRTLKSEVINTGGSGASIDVSRPFLLLIFHPTTTQYGGERQEMENLLGALDTLRMQTLLLWPNIDAGADHISKAIRVFRDQTGQTWLKVLTNLSPENYLKVLCNASCAVGNSSSFVRDASYFGTPVVLVGARQYGREMDEHVMPTMPIATEVAEAVRYQLSHGRYEPSVLYGDGDVSGQISAALARLTPYVQKRLHYIYEKSNGNGHTVDWFVEHLA